MSAIRKFLERQATSGAWVIGQVRVTGLSLRNVAEAEADDLTVFTRPEDAREIAKFDDEGHYRPLKTAPNLRRGWQLNLRSIEDLRQSLDFLYPAALGTWLAAEQRELVVTPLRQTLGRQTGMYRVTQRITNEQALGVIHENCVEGCLRRRLWTLDGRVATEPGSSTTAEVPILCVEACNLLVAACRPVAKQNLPPVETAP